MRVKRKTKHRFMRKL